MLGSCNALSKCLMRYSFVLAQSLWLLANRFSGIIGLSPMLFILLLAFWHISSDVPYAGAMMAILSLVLSVVIMFSCFVVC